MYTKIIRVPGCLVLFKFIVESDFSFSNIVKAFSNLICEEDEIDLSRVKTISILSKNDRTHILLNGVFYLSCEKDNTEIILSAIIDIISESFDCFPQGFSFYHAYVVAREKKAILLVAPTHQGKTTLGTALTLNGYTYLSDDVAIFNENGQLIPFDLPIKLRKTDLLRKSELLKKYHVIATKNYDFLIPYQNISGFFSPQKVIFLKRNHEDKNTIDVVKLDKFEALQRLISNASYCSNIFTHTLASKSLVQKCDTITEIIYNSGLEVLKFISR